MNNNIHTPLFHPHVAKNSKKYVADTLSTKWIGQGRKVDIFEERIKTFLKLKSFPIAVSSGTAALHIAYILAGVKAKTDVLCPVFTCTATNLPIIYQNANPIFLDVSTTSLNIELSILENSITKNTVALSVVDYGGLPNNYKILRDFCDKYKLKLIADCAHAIDGSFKGKHISEYADYTIFSFQAIKVLTTGDGGMLLVKDKKDLKTAQKLRWFGINRSDLHKGIWENDIYEIGFKYQMNNISASMGIAAIEELGFILSKRRQLYQTYIENLGKYSDLLLEKTNDDVDFTPWIITLNTKGRRVGLMKHLLKKGIESAQVHYRNDKYSVFKKYAKGKYPNMDSIEDDYLVLPLHTKMSNKNVIEICHQIKIFLKK